MTITPERMLMTDRVAVVTGAAQGIGEATAIALARFGCHVAICDREPEGLADTARAIEALGRRALAEVFDVRDAEAVERFFARVDAELGPVDVLVNNVGGGFHAPFSDVSAKGEAALIAENFGTVTNCVRSASGRFAEGAAVVNVTSVEAYHAAPGFGVYAAMKAAVEQFSKTLALELSDRGIRVNCLSPAPTDTPMMKDFEDQIGADFMREHFQAPVGRNATSEEMAEPLVFLGSRAARFVSGVNLFVDFGYKGSVDVGKRASLL